MFVAFFNRSLLSLLLFIFVFLLPFFTLANTDNDTLDSTAETGSVPNITSEDFVTETMWHNIAVGKFTWNLPDDVTAVAVELATTSTHEPLEVYKPPIDTFEVATDDLKEGLQFLTVQFKDKEGWGEVVSYHLLVDLTAPKDFAIESYQDGTSGEQKIFFNTTDDLSGVDYYEVLLPGQPVVKLEESAADEGYLLTGLQSGVQTVEVRAYDKAGNVTVSFATVDILPIQKEVALFSSEQAPFLLTFLALLLLGFAVLELLYILRLQRESVRREVLLNKEIEEIGRQTEKVFSALRDEVYDQIRVLTSRKKMTKKESEVVKSLSKALEVSKQLIEKEVNDASDIVD